MDRPLVSAASRIWKVAKATKKRISRDIIIFGEHSLYWTVCVYKQNNCVIKSLLSASGYRTKEFEDAESFQILSYGHTLSIKMTTHQQLYN